MNNTTQLPVVSINGYELHIHDDLPMVQDLDLAERLGFSRPRDIRKLINRLLDANSIALEQIRVATAQSPGGGRPSTVYYLSEKAVFKVVTKSETEKAGQITDEMIDVFIDYRTGKLTAPQLPQTFAEALRLAAQLEEDKLLAEGQRDEAIRTKAQIGSRREAVAMATASVATRRVNKLEEQLGVNEQWKQVKAISWLREFFAISRVMYQQVGRKLSAISSELELKPKEIEDSNYGKIKAYHVDVVDEFYRLLKVDAELMGKYRIG